MTGNSLEAEQLGKDGGLPLKETSDYRKDAGGGREVIVKMKMLFRVRRSS